MMKRLLFIACFSVLAKGQVTNHQFRIIPDSTRANVGMLELYDKQSPSHKAVIKPVDSMAADVTWLWPGGDALGCLSSDGVGNLSFGSCITHLIINPSLSVTNLILRDAAGTTTGDGFALQNNASSPYFRIIGGTDAGAPGTVVTHDIVPFDDNTWKLGNINHRWINIFTDLVTVGASSGNQVNIGLDYANSLKNGTAGLTSWAIGVDSNITPHGLLRLSDSSGSGGFDGNGAQIYCSALNGECQAIQFSAIQNGLVTNIGSSDTLLGLEGINIQASSLTGTEFRAGMDYLDSRVGSTNQIVWRLSQSSGYGRLRLSDSSGAGGLDGIGAQIFANATTGVVQTVGGFANIVSVGSPDLYNRFQAVDTMGNPNGGFFGSQVLALQDHVYAQLGSTLGSVSGLKIYPDTTGNTFNAGIDFVNSLNNGVAGATIFALAQNSNKGILRLSDGSGAGGIDGDGAQIFADANTGVVTAQTGFVSHAATFNAIQSVDGSGNPNGGYYGLQALTYQDHVYAQLGSTLGTVTGLQIYPDGVPPDQNHLNAGVDFINSLKNGTAGATIWALGQSSNSGILRLSDGSGSGGFDGNGAQILLTAVNGNIQAEHAGTFGAQFTLLNGSMSSNNTAVNMGGWYIFGTDPGGSNVHEFSLYDSLYNKRRIEINPSGDLKFQSQGGNTFSGQLQATQNSLTTTIGASGTGVALQIQASSFAGNDVNIGVDYINALVNGTPGATIFALANSSNNGLLRLSNGSGSGGWDGNGAQIFEQASNGSIDAVSLKVGSYSGGNQVNVGLDYINSLKFGISGLTMWAFGQSGNVGVMRISNGSGSGGLDGNGAYVYADGSHLKASSLDMTGGSIFAPSGSGTLTGTTVVRNSSGAGTCTLTFSGGLLTGTTC